MDIYIAQRVYHYEGFKIIGVFDDLEEAKAACITDELDKEDNLGDAWEVTCHYLKKPNALHEGRALASPSQCSC